MIYLDYAANSPIDKEVLDTYYEVSEKYFANPNSTHKLGLEAKKIIDDATQNIANNLKILPEEIIYTSGASESNNLVIQGVLNRYKNKGKHIIISKLEHNSIIAPLQVMQNNGFEIDMVGITKEGLIDIGELKKLIRDDTILVSITSVDSELGIKQPIEEIANLLKDYENIIFHTDASQSIGKIDIDFKNVDLITIAPHKFYGINGIGALIKKKNISLTPIIYGGKSTTIYRSGTPALPLIVSLDKALELALSNMQERNKYVKHLNELIKKELLKYDDIHINSTYKSIPYTINFSIKGILSKEFVNRLSEKEVYVSTKSACCPDNTPSKSVYALTGNKKEASSSIRLSLSHLTKEEEIINFFKVFDETYKEFKNGKI